MKKCFVGLISVLAISACDVTEPIVSDFNGDSVTVVTGGLDSKEYQRETAAKEASRICGKVGKKAEYASTRSDPNTYQNYNLYLCL
ncbi:hypothetical protein [uncultured Litoreibacter sp.]|uniref:hypothetical protein n=1 Tax=uncultured Litoreibacter sp. TaxID=1392394 RepID=UPI002638167B|nr:hypothetical protein [uncultured Litoreibacter sp.]